MSTTPEARAAFLDIVHEHLRAITLPDETLLELGAGLVHSLIEDRYDFDRVLAENYGIPGLVTDTLTAAALATLWPNTGAALIARPNAATMEHLRDTLADYGVTVDVHSDAPSATD